MPPVDPLNGGRRYLPCPEMYVSAADSSWLMPQELKLCLILHTKAGANVRANEEKDEMTRHEDRRT